MEGDGGVKGFAGFLSGVEGYRGEGDEDKYAIHTILQLWDNIAENMHEYEVAKAYSTKLFVNAALFTRTNNKKTHETHIMLVNL